VSGTGNESEDKWTFGIRLLSKQVPRASVRMTLTYKFHPRLTAGVEYNPRVDEVAPIANLLVLTETKRRPAFIVGTSSDRIGTPSGQSFYGLFSKNLRRATGLPIAPYVGLAYGTYEDRLRLVGGLNINFPKNFSATITYNGVDVHPIINYTYKRHVLSLVMVRMRYPGLSYSISF
jgi:hypothetical protein